MTKLEQINEGHKNLVFDVADTIQGWFPRHDMDTLYGLAQKYVKPHGTVLEVGSWKGRSSLILAEVCRQKNAKLICMDSFKGLIPTDHVKYDLYHGENGYYKEGNEGTIMGHILENLRGYDVNFLEGNSTNLHKRVKDGTCDLVFIDGDHDEPIVSQDIKNFKPKVKTGGVFCGHDYEIQVVDVVIGDEHKEVEKPNSVAVAVNDNVGEVKLFTTIWYKEI